MVMQCISAVCILGVVIVGLLVMTQAISLETLVNGLWRSFLLVVAVLVGLCVLKSLLLPILTSWLVALKQIAWWVVVIVLVLIAAVPVLRMLITKFAKWPSAQGSHNREDL
jgi:hypothetical protein